MIRITDSIRSCMPLIACTFVLTKAAVAGVELSEGTQAFNAANVGIPANDSLDKDEFATTLGEAPSQKKINKSFKKADRDKDAAVSLDEYLIFVGEKKPPTKQEAAFAAADEDSNGLVTEAEYIAATQGKGSYIAAKRFLLTDTEDEETVGSLTIEEWKTKRRKAAKGEFLTFDLADIDEDGELTPFEFYLTLPKNTTEAKVIAKFLKLDDNEDEVLTKDEWNPGAPKNVRPPELS